MTREDEGKIEWFLIPRVIPLNLFLDTVRSYFEDVTRSLFGCFGGIDVED